MLHCSFVQIILISHSRVTIRKSLMGVRDLLATLGHECNHPHFRPMLRDVEPSTSTPIDYRHAFLMTPEMVFRYVVNIRLISCRSDLGPFSPQPLSLILNVGSVVARPSQRFVEMPSPHSSAAHNPTPPKQPHYSHHQDEVSSLVTALVLSKFRQHKTDRYVFSTVAT
jgi:hypothetical protein